MLSRLRRKISHTRLWSVDYSNALILAQALIVIGCTTPPPAKEVSNAKLVPQAFPEGDYFPLRHGSWWAMSQRYSSHGKPDPGDYVPSGTASIDAVTLDGDVATASVISVTRMAVACPAVVGSSCPPFVDQSIPLYWIKEKSGKVWQQHQTIPGRSLLFLLPRSLGSEVTLPATVSISGYSEKHISDTVQEATLAPLISTALGDFKDCLKLNSTFTVADHFTDPILKAVSVINSTESTAIWLARDIGLVKHVYTKTHNDNTQMVVETSIASYSVSAN